MRVLMQAQSRTRSRETQPVHLRAQCARARTCKLALTPAISMHTSEDSLFVLSACAAARHQAWLRMSLSHCSTTVIRISPRGTVSLRELGNTHYLPPHLITTS